MKPVRLLMKNTLKPEIMQMTVSTPTKRMLIPEGKKKNMVASTIQARILYRYYPSWYCC